MRTLVISDLHLGALGRRDVLREPAALERLLDALDGMDRLVLLGDTVEMLEGRPRTAMALAEPVLRAIGDKVGRGREIIVVPGNHDHALVRPWLRGMRRRERKIGLSARVPARSGRELAEVVSWLKPARVRVHYPGITLAPGVWATHGHYLDRHLLPEGAIGISRRLLGTVPPKAARPEHYENASGPSVAAMQGLLAATLPEVIGEPLDRIAGAARRGAMAALPVATALRGGGALAPLSAGLLGYQFRRAGLPAMGEVAERLRVRAQHVLFGHVHRLGPMPADPIEDWDRHGRLLHNTGCWVYEPLLLAGAEPPHPYWPGGAMVVEDGVQPRAVSLLDDFEPGFLRD